MAESTINSKQFSLEFEKKGVEKIYLFLGEEEGEKDKFISKIASRLFPDDQTRKNSTGRFHIENGESLQAADFALSVSMFSDIKLCIMRNIDGASSRDARRIISEVLDSLPQSTYLVMTSTLNRVPEPLTATQAKKIKTVQFWRMFESDLQKYVLSTLKAFGTTIEDRALSILIDLTGNDIKKIDEAVEMIRFSGETGRITEQTVRDFVADVRESRLSDFTEMLFRKDRKALGLIERLLNDGVPELFIIASILRYAESMEKYNSLLSTGTDSASALKLSGVYQKNSQIFAEQASIFRDSRLKKVFISAAKADRSIKSSRFDSAIVSNPVFICAEEIIFSK